MTERRHWDIVCRVVDNYGDAGVALRLARQLVAEHAQRVTLWIDDPAPLARLAPGFDPRADDSVLDGVAVRRGPTAETPWTPADVVVDAFGGGLPDRWIDAFARAPRPPVWIVLEYLTAEAWADDAHRRASPEPRTGLRRTYWCPGFTSGTGGLLREAGLFARRDAFRGDPASRSAALAEVGVAVPARALVALLFCYPTPAIQALLDAWAEGDAPLLALVPRGVAVDALDRWTGGNVPHPGAPCARGSLTLASIPFVPQADFDRLLWACDFAVVRGEDSFVRAQWAAMPFAWNAYPQADGAHHAKAAAFLERYLEGAPRAAADAAARFTGALNRGDGPALAAAWPAFDRARPALAAHGRDWSDRLAGRPDLASGLVEFALARL